MPPRPRFRLWRPVRESFSRITWDERNRLDHEAKRPFPPWKLASHADWSRVMKRKDVEHPGPPDRFQALVGIDLAGRLSVLFVVYSKEQQALNVITMRMANEDERGVFFLQYG